MTDTHDTADRPSQPDRTEFRVGDRVRVARTGEGSFARRWLGLTGTIHKTESVWRWVKFDEMVAGFGARWMLADELEAVQ